MRTFSFSLDEKRADRLTRWARVRKTTKSEIVREMIDRAGPIVTSLHPIDHVGSIVTADDLIEACNAAAGRGLGLAQR